MEVSERKRSWLVVWKLSVQSSRQERSSWGRCSTEKRVYCIRQSMGSQWREARWGDTCSVLGTRRTRGAEFVLNFVRGTEDSQTGENCSSQGGKEQRQKQKPFSRTKTKNAAENKEKDWSQHFLHTCCSVYLVCIPLGPQETLEVAIYSVIFKGPPQGWPLNWSTARVSLYWLTNPIPFLSKVLACQ